MKKKQFIIGLFSVAILSTIFGVNALIFDTFAVEAQAPVINEVETFLYYPTDGLLTIKASNLVEREEDNFVFLNDKELVVSEVRATRNGIDVFLNALMSGGDLTIQVGDLTSEPFEISFPTPSITSIEFPDGQLPEVDFLIHGAGFTEGASKALVEIFAENNNSTYTPIIEVSR